MGGATAPPLSCFLYLLIWPSAPDGTSHVESRITCSRPNVFNVWTRANVVTSTGPSAMCEVFQSSHVEIVLLIPWPVMSRRSYQEGNNRHMDIESIAFRDDHFRKS